MCWRLPSSGSRAQVQSASRLRPGRGETYSWPILDPGNVLAVDLLSRDPRGNREQRYLRSLLQWVRKKGRCHGE